MGELLPCPFCGGKAIPPQHDHARMWVIRCQGCNVEVWDKNDGHFEADFIPMIAAAWNRRALPAASAEDVRAGALKEAAAYHESMAADEDALSAKYRGGSNPWFAHVQAAKWHREHAAAILALIPEQKP